MSDESITVLLIEDNPGDARLIREFLSEVESHSFLLTCADRLSKGLEFLSRECVDLVLLDLSLPDSQGWDTFVRVHAQAPELPIVVLTGFDDETLAVKAVQEGAQDYLVKVSVDSSLLMRAMRYAIERKKTERALRKAREELEVRVDARTLELARANEELRIEIAERRRAEEALRREHSFLTAIVERAAEGLCVCHEITEHPFVNFTVWNERMTEITGYTIDEINRLGWYQSLYPDPRVRGKVIDRMSRMRRGEDLISEEWEITHADGEKRVVHVSTSIVQTDEGITHFLALMHDITQQKMAEEELVKCRNHLEVLVTERTSELVKTNALLQLETSERKRANEALRKAYRELQDIIDFLPDATFVIDREKKIIAWNHAIEQMTGVRKGDILGKGDYAYAIPFYGERRPILIDLVMSAESDIEQRYDFVEKKGKNVYGEVFVPKTYEGKGAYLWGTASPLFGKDGNVIGAIQSIRDISAYKQAGDAVRQQLNFQQTLIDTIPSPIFYKDTEGKYLGCNAAFESFIGLCKADIIGKTVYETHPKDLADIYYEADLALFLEPGVQQYETCIQYADGTRHDVFFTKGTFSDLDGNAAGLVGVMIDITERKRAEQELSRYRDHLEDLVKERTAELARTNEQLTYQIEERRRAEEALKDSSEKLKFFAYSVAHDLKSPAIGVYGLTKRLSRHARDVLDEKSRSYCDQILKVSEHIAAFVEKINVYIATKEALLSIETVDVEEILQTLKDEFSAQLNIRQIDWRTLETPVEIKADRLSMLRAFRNLVDNSLKYGGEKLSRIWIGYDESEDQHIFSFSDDGKGLKAGDSEKIFAAFQRHETSRGIEGAGLGLTIVKEIAEQHGGKVWVEPRSKKGTTSFCISISKNL
jgi:PAS domain S-box-containing protein